MSLFDVKNGSNILYLPLDKMMQTVPSNSVTAPVVNAPHVASASVEPTAPQNITPVVPSIEHTGVRNRQNDMRRTF
jgi:hypothetical protein